MNDTAQVLYLPHQPQRPSGDPSAPVEHNHSADLESLKADDSVRLAEEQRARESEKQRAREAAKLREHDRICQHLKFRLEQDHKFPVKFIDKEPMSHAGGRIFGYTLGMEVAEYKIPNCIWVYYDVWHDAAAAVEVVVDARSRDGASFGDKRVYYNKHESGEYAYHKISEHVATYVRRQIWLMEMRDRSERRRIAEEQERAEAERKRVERRQNVTELISDAAQVCPELPPAAHRAAVAIYEFVAGKDQSSAVLLLVQEALARRRGAGLDQL